MRKENKDKYNSSYIAEMNALYKIRSGRIAGVIVGQQRYCDALWVEGGRGDSQIIELVKINEDVHI